MRFFALDFETSGINPMVHRPLQVGIVSVAEPEHWWACDIGWDYDSLPSEDKALEVNGFTRDRIEAGMNVAEVDRRLRAWLPDGPLYAVGWNIAFYLAFLGRWLDLSAIRFHYRAVDLTTLCLSIADRWDGTEERYRDIKAEAKQFSRSFLLRQGIEEKRHDALYDARASVCEWHFLQSHVHP